MCRLFSPAGRTVRTLRAVWIKLLLIIIIVRPFSEMNTSISNQYLTVNNILVHSQIFHFYNLEATCAYGNTIIRQKNSFFILANIAYAHIVLN